MSVTTAEVEATQAEEAAAQACMAAAEANIAAASEDAPLDALTANAQTRAQLRREVEKRELRLAGRDLAEGVRGVIRAAPILAVLAGVAAGLALGRRRRPTTRRR